MAKEYTKIIHASLEPTNKIPPATWKFMNITF